MQSRTYQLFVAVALSIAVPSISVMAASPSSTKKEIQNNYNKMASAIIRKDVKSATSYFTNDYVGIDRKGNRKNAEEMRQYYSSIMPAQVKIVKNQIAIQDFNADSNMAQVLVQQRADLTFGASKIISQNTYRDLWVKTPQGWRLKQSENMSSSTTFNGKQLAS